MKTIAETFRIAYQPGDVFRFKPIADVHYLSRHCDVRTFKQFLSCADDKTYFIGLGDLLDMIIVSDVKRYRKSGDASEGEDIINDAVNGMYDILKPYADRIIGLGQGNHEDTIVKRCSINPTKWLCDRLGVSFCHLVGYIHSEFGQYSWCCAHPQVRCQLICDFLREQEKGGEG